MTMKREKHRSLRKKHLAHAFVLLGVATGFALALTGGFPVPEVRIHWDVPPAETDNYRPRANRASGEELALVYIGSSSCSWSNIPELPGIVRNLKTTLHYRARDTGRAFAAVGIARDGIAADGVAHLAKFGGFDEVMSGRGWANTGIQKYIYGAMPGEGATPQVLVVVRSLDYALGHISVVDERVLVRKVGSDDIVAWATAGAHVPL